jgi:ribosome modulation factor
VNVPDNSKPEDLVTFLYLIEGRAAFDDGVRIIACPYDATSPCGSSWLAGWMQQHERRKNKTSTKID